MTKGWTKGYEMDTGEFFKEYDINQVLATFRGILVLPTGLELEVVETSGSPNNYVQINTGKAWIEDTLGEVTSTQQVQISGVTAGGQARIDAITIDSGTNQVGKIVGTEAAIGSQKPPDIPEDKCILAFVTVTDTEPPTVVNADITDRRFFGYYVESDLISGDAIPESKIIFDDSTGHAHGGTGNDGTNIPEANVDYNITTGHDHDGVGSKVVDHVDLANKGTNTHAQLDTHLTAGEAHIVNTSNPHTVTDAQILTNQGKLYQVASLEIISKADEATITATSWADISGTVFGLLTGNFDFGSATLYARLMVEFQTSDSSTDLDIRVKGWTETELTGINSAAGYFWRISQSNYVLTVPSSTASLLEAQVASGKTAYVRRAVLVIYAELT